MMHETARGTLTPITLTCGRLLSCCRLCIMFSSRVESLLAPLLLGLLVGNLHRQTGWGPCAKLGAAALCNAQAMTRFGCSFIIEDAGHQGNAFFYRGFLPDVFAVTVG